MEWRVRKNFIFACWQLHLEEIFLDNLDIFALRDVSAEFFGGLVIRFDGNYLFTAAAERGGNHARASADIEHSIALPDVAMANQKSCEFWPA